MDLACKIIQIIKKKLNEACKCAQFTKVMFYRILSMCFNSSMPTCQGEFPSEGRQHEGTEENPSPSSAYESSMFISFAIRMATA